MVEQVLVIGGQGRIGHGVVLDLLKHTTAQVTITGRSYHANESNDILNARTQFLALELDDRATLKSAIAAHNLVIHCAGPFRQREAIVLQDCIEAGVHYLDVSDDRVFTKKALSYREAAKNAGITAIINTGIFPGISNSMVRQGVEQFDTVDRIHLSYVVAGSGGAGTTVMRTTFLNLQNSFDAWLEGQWQSVKPYTARETIDFPPPFGKTGVYWFDMPECFTLVETYPTVDSVITKFGSSPDFYNHLTAMVAQGMPRQVLRQPLFIETLAQISHRMTDFTDRFSGQGVAVRAEVQGKKADSSKTDSSKTDSSKTDSSKADSSKAYVSSVVHHSAAIATGIGTGSIAEYILSGQIAQPGVWAVEQALPTDLFEQSMQNRGLAIDQSWLWSEK